MLLMSLVYWFFSTIFQYQPIRCINLIKVNFSSHLLIDFTKCLPTYYTDQYLNMTYGTWTECKNRDPVFGFQVSRPHLETGEKCTKHKCYPNSIFWQNRKLIWINPLAPEGESTLRFLSGVEGRGSR